MNTPYQIIRPLNNPVPIVISVPHCGTAIPKSIIDKYDQNKIQSIPDTDFFVDRLYDFATDIGITIIKANYSRWVIDLNRNPENKQLYKDGRIITSLTPLTDFEGVPIYKTEQDQPLPKEVKYRLEKYYNPYHHKISEILSDFKQQYGIAVLWDAHSIKRFVPTIYDQPFPDLVLGTNDHQSASQNIIDQTIKKLSASDYSLSLNDPFKGGHITRSFGNPKNNIHALQLEMSKDCYMDDSEMIYHKLRAEKIQILLRQTLLSLISQLDLT